MRSSRSVGFATGRSTSDGSSTNVTIFDEEGAEIEAAERLADHEGTLEEHGERIEDLDERLGNLEEQARPFSWTSRNS